LPMKQNLVEILLSGRETKELDYKAPCSWDSNDKNALCELVKDIMALGNTKGGYLVIGVSEVPNGWKYEGLTDEQMKTFETTKVNQFVNKYADPPINVSIQPVNHDGKNFIIISVPQFTDTPHICQKDFPGVIFEADLFVRTDNNESAPIKKSVDFRMILETAISNRSDQLLKSFRTILKHGDSWDRKENDESKFLRQANEARKIAEKFNTATDKDYGYRETVFYPEIFKEDAFQIEELFEMAKQASVNYTGWPFLYVNENNSDQSYIVEDGIETLLSGQDVFFTGGDGFYYWKLFRSGLLYVNELFLDDSRLRAEGKPDKILDFDRLALMAGQATDCLVRLYKDRVDSENEISMIFILKGIEGKHIDSIGRNRLFMDGYVCKIAETTYSSKNTLTEWKAGVVDHAVEICKHVLHRFNWATPNLLECKKIIERMFQRKFH